MLFSETQKIEKEAHKQLSDIAYKYSDAEKLAFLYGFKLGAKWVMY